MTWRRFRKRARRRIGASRQANECVNRVKLTVCDAPVSSGNTGDYRGRSWETILEVLSIRVHLRTSSPGKSCCGNLESEGTRRPGPGCLSHFTSFRVRALGGQQSGSISSTKTGSQQAFREVDCLQQTTLIPTGDHRTICICWTTLQTIAWSYRAGSPPSI